MAGPACGEGAVDEVEIYAGKDWYQAREENEQSWVGVLEKRRVIEGPNSRASLHYALVTQNGELPVYASNVVELLQPFVGRRVTVRGKVVDLSSEGFAPELWVGTIKGKPD